MIFLIVNLGLYKLIYMIEILEQYIFDEGGSLSAERLIEESERIKKEIEYVQRKVDKIQVDGLFSKKSKSDQKLLKILEIAEISQEELALDLETLNKQEIQLKNLISYNQIFYEQSRQDPEALNNKIHSLKELVNQAEANNFPLYHVEALKAWTKKMVGNLQKKLCDIVVSFPNSIRIVLSHITIYSTLLDEEICRSFIKTIFKDMIVYDVPTFSYVLLAPSSYNVDQSGTIIIERSPVIFKAEQANKNYDTIVACLQDYKKTSRKILDVILGKEETKYLGPALQGQIKNSLQIVKGVVQYILPYLSLQKRRQLIQLLLTKTKDEASIYDILVRLRLKGQDGEMMQNNIRQLIEKVERDSSLVDEICVFLQICESDNKTLNIGFYVCDQLLNRLEDKVPYQHIQKILHLREDIRFKIHYPE